MTEARRRAKDSADDAAAAGAANNSDSLYARKRSMVSRLRRIEGQLRGVQNMVEQDADCEAVAQQISAARRALERAFYEVVACAMEAELHGAESLVSARFAGTKVARILAKYG